MVRIKFAHCPLSWLRCVTQIWLLLALMLWLGLPFDIPTSSMVSCLISDDLIMFPTQVPPETSTHASAAWASLFFGRKSHCSWSASFFNTPIHSPRHQPFHASLNDAWAQISQRSLRPSSGTFNRCCCCPALIFRLAFKFGCRSLAPSILV